MVMTRAALTDADIQALVRGATEDERAAAAHKLCRRLDEVSEAEREVAGEILRLVASDAAELVRRALVVTLKQSTILPRDVAMRLARDVDSVAVPLLNHSPVFTDEDLTEIVTGASALKQIAIARRPAVAEGVVSVLVREGCIQAVKAVCANDNAEFSERTLAAVVDRFADEPDVTTAVAYRKVLPLAITEKLVALVSDGVRQHLMDRHALSPDVASKIVLGARERATVDLVEQAQNAGDLNAFAAHLHRQASLTPSLLLRSLAHGNIAFFERALSALSGVPHHRVWLMVHDAGPLGLRAIYERAELPGRLFPAFRVAVDTFHALQVEGEAADTARFQERMLQRFLTQPHSASREDLDYLLDRLDALARKPRARPAKIKGAA